MGHYQRGVQHEDEEQEVDDVVPIACERVLDKLQGGRTYSDPEECRREPETHPEVLHEVVA